MIHSMFQCMFYCHFCSNSSNSSSEFENDESPLACLGTWTGMPINRTRHTRLVTGGHTAVNNELLMTVVARTHRAPAVGPEDDTCHAAYGRGQAYCLFSER